MKRETHILGAGTRILLVLQSADPPTSIGGMETLCVALAAEYASRGLHVTAIVPETGVFDVLEARFAEAGADVRRLTTDGRNGRGAQIRRWRQFASLLQELKPHVIHLHTGGATGGLAVTATGRLFSSATVVVTEHDVPDAHPSRLQRSSRHALDASVHAIIAVSRRNASVRCDRLGSRPRRLAALLNGISFDQAPTQTRASNREATRAHLGIDRSSTVIGSLVRLAAGKGLDDLLNAFAIVFHQHPCELLLVGDGPLRQSLEALARELEIDTHVHFAGHQLSPAPYLDAMDVFALCVPDGSQSIALLEAMGRGVAPVITFWGPEEPVVPEVAGLAAAPSDPVALASVLLRVVTDGELRARLAAGAETHVRRNFSIERVANEHLEIYASAREGAVPERLLN